MKPFHTFLFLCAVGLLSLALAWVMPKNGIPITDEVYFRFASLEKDTLPPSQQIADVSEYLEQLETEIDSTAIRDSLQRVEIARRKKLALIQWPNDNHTSMHRLFSQLEKVKTQNSKSRIMHYGDSQIEGDRITSVIRKELQDYYGGTGPGLLPAVEGVENAAMLQSHSENWKRYTLYGRVDTNIRHSRYGSLMSFGMFTSPLDTFSSEKQSAWIEFAQSGMTYASTRKYNEVYAYYGFASDTFSASVFVDDELYSTNTYLPKNSFGLIKWDFPTPPKKLRMEFSSRKSPEFYAFSFEGKSGVIVDNIGLRGSSGTLFKKTDATQYRQFLQSQPIDLLILQFGGNSVPYVESKEKAIGYGKWFSSQIRYLQSILPNVSIIVIGPSDMATKINGEFTTFPNLEFVRDALKEAAFENGCGYWDLYEVMGGRNSMISWVESTPPLAGKDYVHFNNLGMRKVSELFMKAFWHEKRLWEQSLTPKKVVVEKADTLQKSSVND